MQDVAQKLVSIAVIEPTSPYRDNLVRSAFSRFYYDTFLATRTLVRHILDDPLLTPKHAYLPPQLTGEIARLFANRGEVQARNQLLKPELSKKIVSRARNDLAALAEILRVGCAVRVIADYRDEIPVAVGKGFRLGGNTTAVAAHRCSDVHLLCRNLLQAWETLNGR